VPWVEGMTALHTTAWLHGHYPPTYISQPRTYWHLLLPIL